MRCPSCGNENEADALYCASCGAAVGKTCGSCGAVVPASKRYCTQCGADLDAPRREPAAAAAPSGGGYGGQPNAPGETGRVTAPKAKGRKGRGCLGCLTIPLILLLALAAAGYLWLIWPDLPPRPWEAAWSNISSLASQTIRDRLPFLPSEKPPPKLDPQAEKEVQAAVEAEWQRLSTPRPGSREEKQAQLRAQLRATGLPIEGAYVLSTDGGEPILSVGLRYNDLTGGVSQTGGLSEGINAMLRLVDTKTLSLSGLHDVVVDVVDEQGRTIFAIAAPVSSIEAYRAGRAGQRELIRSIGFKGESRAGMLDAMRKMVMP